MAAEKRLTVWPGSDPNDLTQQSIPFSDHNNLKDKPVPLQWRTPSRDEGPSSHKRTRVQTGIFAPRLPSNNVPNTYIANDSRHNQRPNSALSSVAEGNETEALTKQRSDHRTGRLPRVIYHEFMSLEQAGLAVMGCDNTRERNLVAIKRLKGVGKTFRSMMQPFTADQVVGVKDMFFDIDDLVIIYEQMDISLRQVTGILQGPLKDFQIAAICKELVGGLAYIHDELSLYHGNLNCGEIILNCDGMVKIANIGEAFARGRQVTADDRHKDVQSIGFVMIELMEPTTYILNPHSTELQSPERWRDGSGIKDFLRATQHHSLGRLINHDFLPKEPLVKCLKAHVFCALWAAKTEWDILSLP